MHTEKQFEAALSVAAEAEKVSGWERYAEYCRLREQGLRRPALAVLDRFLAEASTWDFAKQKTFVQWLCAKMDPIPLETRGVFPEPLRKALFTPLFEQWVTKESDNDEAWALRAQYGGDYETAASCYREAVRINPRNQRARTALAKSCIDRLWFGTHHLPDGLLIDCDFAKTVIEEACEHITYIEDRVRKERFSEQVIEEKQLINDWIAFKEDGGDDFAAWCAEKGRDYSWVETYRFKK